MKENETGKKLEKLRGNRSQEETAQALGVSLESYRAYENGGRVPSDEVKQRIADYYGKSVKELFFCKKQGRDMMEIAKRLREERNQAAHNGILARYDLKISELLRLRDLERAGMDPYDIICAAFDYGFIMGHRATLKGYKENRGAAK